MFTGALASEIVRGGRLPDAAAFAQSAAALFVSLVIEERAGISQDVVAASGYVSQRE